LSNSKPGGPEIVPRCTSFENGDIEKYIAKYRSQGLGAVSKSKGCVSSHCDVSSSPQISEFYWQGQHYPFNAMPFGLALAPIIFTKLMTIIGSYMRKRQIQVFISISTLSYHSYLTYTLREAQGTLGRE
jgi:hypothetical protein